MLSPASAVRYDDNLTNWNRNSPAFGISEIYGDIWNPGIQINGINPYLPSAAAFGDGPIKSVRRDTAGGDM